ncbi:hypothetical protein HF086_015682 [Spodoptera exigua]|uniref:CCHC-type domain-containing protein n=1 Tax=Spodoptera exigua TaxID=7107 RepID=A0A922MNX2_SPOEX|nr:hypothetical protein HF086_015682 [Spodoptera exigua]
MNSNFNTKQSVGNDSKTSKPSSSTSITCFNCKEVGHFSVKCPQKLRRCNICKRIGHVTIDCPQLSNEKSKDVSTEKKVMKVDVEDTSNEKYMISLKINDVLVRGYVDLGSQCTLIQYSVAKSLGVTWSVGKLPVMRD